MMLNSDDWQPRDIPDLEPAAWEALRAGTASVTAGPGAGKSEFLAQRASFLLETGLCPPPQQILAISFKRDAAANLRRRVQARLPDYASRFTSMTFDAFTKSLVDRFRDLLPTAWALRSPYRIGFASPAEVGDFLYTLGSTAPAELRDGIFQIRQADFVSNVVGSHDLPLTPQAPTTAVDYAVQQWWSQKYTSVDRPTLDFVMLNRLAELLIRSNPQLRRALTATYPFVFIDEFQDTTYAQYSFLRSVFASAGTTVTVVGDRKQRIMGWAGALADAFGEFEEDFAARTFELTWNFRSTAPLVELQQRFAARLDATSQPQVSQVATQVTDSPTQIWSFSNPRLEAETIAAWIAADLEESGRTPPDYALIARQRVADLEPEIRRALMAHGIRVRNDDALVGAVRLQDLLKDDLVRLLVGLIRMGAVRGGEAQTWREVTSALARVAPSERDREVGTRADDELSAFLSDLRAWFRNTPLDSEGAVPDLVARLTSFLKLEEVARKRVFADRPEDVDVTLEAFAARLSEALPRAEAWNQVASRFIDDDAVPLLTIHRSKGLEYRTVFFIGLDGDQWWAHARDEIESTMTFFVGISRAAERLIFTQCDTRGSRAPIADIYAALDEAGVPLVRFG
jgi:superfamily I DNA/RNA helicase